MLKSNGFFANVNCPYYESGLCERPYCHFKHASKPAAAIPTYVPTPLYSSVVASKPKPKPDSSTRRKTFPKSSSVPDYKPTPISELKKLKELKQNETRIVSASEGSDSKEKRVKSATKSKRSSVEEVVEVDSVPVSETKNESAAATKSNEEDPDSPPAEAVDDIIDADDEVVERETSKTEDTFSIPTKKARIAHKQSDSMPSKPALPRRNKVSATQQMIDRMTPKLKPVDVMESIYSTSTTTTSGKRRIAHNLKPMQTYSKTSTTDGSGKSPTKTNLVEDVKRPTMPLELGGKVPIGVRQKYLNLFIDECLKITPNSKKDAYDRSLQEEKNLFKRASNKNIYINLAANRVKAIRSEIPASSAVSPKKDQNGSKTKNLISHEYVLNGRQAAGCSIEKRQLSLTVKDIDDETLFSLFKRFVLTKEDLKKYGYPLVNEEKKDEVIFPLPENKIKNNFESSRRTCCRCNKIFQVNQAGIPIKREECVYHSGRLWKERGNGFVDRKYSCCKGDSNSDGCCFSSSHVPDAYGHPSLMKGYVSAPKSTDNEFPGIYALDCEMCYTTIGLELTRISVIDHNCKSVYESLVKPKNTILDYNTKFSGIKEEDLISVNVTLEDVHKKLFTFVNSDTILIGHSLDSDLKALKLVHESVVDTAAVFPHKAGLPYRRALKTITAEFLKKIIQDEIGGHDSQEDAMSCMQLMLYKIGQELSKMKKVS